MYSYTLSLTMALDEGVGVGGPRHAPAALLGHGTHCTGSLVGPRAGLDNLQIKIQHVQCAVSGNRTRTAASSTTTNKA